MAIAIAFLFKVTCKLIAATVDKAGRLFFCSPYFYQRLIFYDSVGSHLKKFIVINAGQALEYQLRYALDSI
ncbi:hypothetical protein [Colwellia sp. C1TZA3]|uniref:hypothetical protein n=1 Tax=Colwellia sp. C1TZA3 TaxID=2508879 RepID=UPI00174A3AF8|nr:hypothetical protein [Colwellia sp. C1TZA3]